MIRAFSNLLAKDSGSSSHVGGKLSVIAKTNGSVNTFNCRAEKGASAGRRGKARSTDNRRPDGISRALQVGLNKIEPLDPVLAFNLLSKDD